MASACDSHASRERPLARRGVVQLGAGEIATCGVGASCHEDLAVGEPRGCVVNPRDVHASGAAESAGAGQGWHG